MRAEWSDLLVSAYESFIYTCILGYVLLVTVSLLKSRGLFVGFAGGTGGVVGTVGCVGYCLPHYSGISIV